MYIVVNHSDAAVQSFTKANSFCVIGTLCILTYNSSAHSLPLFHSTSLMTVNSDGEYSHVEFVFLVHTYFLTGIFDVYIHILKAEANVNC